MPGASSAALAAQLLGKESRPSALAVRAERTRRLREALDQMDPIDREVLSLRHFEHLTRAETAQVLNVSEAAGSPSACRSPATPRLSNRIVSGESSIIAVPIP
jgi:RNA polymerase sigma-70 factor (ECF subfamily)